MYQLWFCMAEDDQIRSSERDSAKEKSRPGLIKGRSGGSIIRAHPHGLLNGDPSGIGSMLICWAFLKS